MGELRRSEPVLSWVDEDGDEVVVTSDEELKVALTALTGPVYKLKVKLGDKARELPQGAILQDRSILFLAIQTSRCLPISLVAGPGERMPRNETAMPATKNQAMPAEPKDTKPAEKKPETDKIAEAKKTERGEPSKPATTTDADHTTGQTSANANGLPGILADLTPFMGP